MQVIEHAHARAQERITRVFLQDQGIDDMEKLWKAFEKVWVEVTTPPQVQKDVVSLGETYRAIIAAHGGRIRHRHETN